MMSSKKIAIALLTLVGIFAVAGPAMAKTVNEKIYLRVSNSTDAKAKNDEGTRIKVWIYYYDNGQRGSLQETKIVNKGGVEVFGFKFTDCYKTKHREFVIRAIDSAGKNVAKIASSRFRMTTKDGCFNEEFEFQGFTDVATDNFKVSKTVKGTNDVVGHVHVKCHSAGNCED